MRTTQEKAGDLASGLVVATALMIVFRQRYPRWWFDFSLELTRFAARVGAYLLFGNMVRRIAVLSLPAG